LTTKKHAGTVALYLGREKYRAWLVQRLLELLFGALRFESVSHALGEESDIGKGLFRIHGHMSQKQWVTQTAFFSNLLAFLWCTSLFGDYDFALLPVFIWAICLSC
jgi:hypothetical protein